MAQKSCKKGYSCGLTCISVKLKCRKDGLKGQFVTLAEEYFRKVKPAETKPLTENQIKAFTYWSGPGYITINETILTGSKANKKAEEAKFYMEEGWDSAPRLTIENLKNQVEKYLENKSIPGLDKTLFKEIKNFEATNTLYRGSGYLPDEVISKYKNNVGKEIQEDIYFATSISQSVADGFGGEYRYYITPKKDSSGRLMDGFKNSFIEGEVLYKPGTKFLVDKVIEKNGLEIYLTEK